MHARCFSELSREPKSERSEQAERPHLAFPPKRPNFPSHNSLRGVPTSGSPTLWPSSSSRGVLQESLFCSRPRTWRTSRAFCGLFSSRRVRFFWSSLSEVTGIQDTTKRVRVNRMIRISPVRVIGADGSPLGILAVDAALRMAEEAGLDLVEVAATARPPVVRIMDYGKYKFEMAKQARVAKKKQHVIELKEVKYRPGIDDHDFETKTRHARRFLEEKNKVLSLIHISEPTR